MDIWNEYWAKAKFSPILKNPPIEAYGGTNKEPLASQGMAHFLDASRDRFVEGFSILDYGAGAGILSNFISERLSDFEYYGLEPNSLHGKERIGIANTIFQDKRVFFGLIDEDLNFCLLKKLDVIVLISVFTHLRMEDIKKILDRLQKVFDVAPDCSIIFSCFLGPTEFQEQPQPHIWERFYGRSFITEEGLQEYCNENNLTLNQHLSFVAAHGYVHNIFKITKD